jgi:integrase
MRGGERKRASLGKYPATSLKTARSKALSIIDGTFALQAAQEPESRIKEYVRQLQASQRHKYEQDRLLRAHLLPKTSNLASLTKKDVLAITDGLASSPSSQIHCHRAIKAFLNWCAERDYITTNPMNGVTAPGSDNSRDRVLSIEELTKVWRESFNHNQFGVVIRLCILLGTRKGETTALKAQWINDDVLLIPAEITKNGSEHLLPLSNRAKILITEFTEKAKPNWNSWNKLKKTFDKTTGLSNWTIHDLRRTFSTLLAQLDTPPHIIEFLLNHKSGEVSGVAAIYNRYHYLPQMKQALDRLENELVARKVIT